MNPYEGTVNTTNAAGTNEPLSAHVGAVILVATAGVFLLRFANFKFVVAAGVNSSVG